MGVIRLNALRTRIFQKRVCVCGYGFEVDE